MTRKEYITKKVFENIKEYKFNLLIGTNLLTITNLQLNFHKIDTPTLPHVHKEAQILYYMKGSGIEKIDKRAFEVFPGSFVFIPNTKKHSFFPKKGTTAEIFALRFEIKRNIIKDVGGSRLNRDFLRILKLFYDRRPKIWTVNPETGEKIEEIINQIEQELNERKFGYIISIEGYLLLFLRKFFLSYLQRKGIGNRPFSKKELIFRKVIEYINLNIQKSLSIREVANIFGFSKNYIQKIVKDFTGNSFTRLVHEIKIDYAKELLKNTSLEIKEIAGKCGFYDYNYFTRVFRKIEGIAPTKFRISQFLY